MPRTLPFSLSADCGLPPPSEKRAVTGTGLAKCGALESAAASGVGVNWPVTQKPLVCARAHAGMHAEHAVQRADQVGRPRVCRGRGLPAREKAEADD